MKKEFELPELEPSKEPSKVDSANSFSLPIDLIDIIAGHSTLLMAKLDSVAHTSFYSLYQPELDKRAAKQLMAYVLNPTAENIAKAKAMYAANPRIMFIETEGYELASGIEEYVDEKTGEPCTRLVHRRVIGSPFQAALGTGDSELYNDMATHFDKVENGVERALKQIQDRFPNGFDYPPTDDTFNALMTDVVAAITNDQALIGTDSPSAATKATLTRLRQYLLPKDVTQGHHFNLNQLIKASEVYNQHGSLWNERQLSPFWCQVIGYLELLSPVVDAQAFCTGLRHLLDENEPLSRPPTLTIYNYSSSSLVPYFPKDGESRGLSLDFGVEICRPSGSGAMTCGVADRSFAFVEKLCRAKTSALGDFQRLLAQRAHSRAAEPPQSVHNSLIKHN